MGYGSDDSYVLRSCFRRSASKKYMVWYRWSHIWKQPCAPANRAWDHALASDCCRKISSTHLPIVAALFRLEPNRNKSKFERDRLVTTFIMWEPENRVRELIL